MWYEPLFAELENARDIKKAVAMSAYMRNRFPFLGITTPERRRMVTPYLNAQQKTGILDFAFVDLCYAQPEREYQYVAVQYLRQMQHYLNPSHIKRLRGYITQKSWWDTVDGLDRIVGEIALFDPAVNAILLAWSVDENIWLRRVAIDHQLMRKEKTDTKLLATILKNNFGSREFFINKAIGWSLREYSKTNPHWVRNFIEQYRDQMAPLSIREGGKYVL